MNLNSSTACDLSRHRKQGKKCQRATCA